MEGTKLQELKKKENGTNREWILWLSKKGTNLRSHIGRN